MRPIHSGWRSPDRDRTRHGIALRWRRASKPDGAAKLAPRNKKPPVIAGKIIMARIRFALLLVAPVVLVTASRPAHADDFYTGKTVSVVVGFSPGGGYDLYGRDLARYLRRHVPGNPTGLAPHVPGAGSLTAVR